MTNRTTFIAWALIAASVCISAQVGTGYRVTNGEIAVLCPLTVGGSFEAQTRALSGTVAPALANRETNEAPDAVRASAGPVTLNGELRVDLATLKTGIDLRDRHMREKYLEVMKGTEYAQAVLTGIEVDKLQGKTEFRATLRLHGVEKAVSGTADVRLSDRVVRVTAEFPVSRKEFQIESPRYLGVGVSDRVAVKARFNAAFNEGREYE
jgi:YceI-like domain